MAAIPELGDIPALLSASVRLERAPQPTTHPRLDERLDKSIVPVHRCCKRRTWASGMTARHSTLLTLCSGHSGLGFYTEGTRPRYLQPATGPAAVGPFRHHHQRLIGGGWGWGLGAWRDPGAARPGLVGNGTGGGTDLWGDATPQRQLVLAVSPPPSASPPPPGCSDPLPLPPESPLQQLPWPGLERPGILQALGGLVLGLIALLSSYDHLTIAGHAVSLPQQWGIPCIAVSVATVFVDAQLASRSRLRAAHLAERTADEAAEKRDRAEQRENAADRERNRAALDAVGRRPWLENAREKALSALIRQRCFPPESSSIPPLPWQGALGNGEAGSCSAEPRRKS